MRVLMLGNSFTFYHDLPQLVAAFTGAQVTAHTRGGASLREQINPKTELGARTLQALTQEKWDYVILQERSLGPIDAAAEFQESAAKLCALSRAAGAKPLFYATWAYRAGSEKLAATGLSYEEMAQRLEEAYGGAAKACDALLAPVGRRFAQVGTLMELYEPDDYHPSPAGSLLAAQTLVRTLEAAEGC